MIYVTLVSFFLALGLTIGLVGQLGIFLACVVAGRAASINSTLHTWLAAALWTVFLWSLLQ